ncbi:hypothetical protein [Negativibacillus massiliensis]
MQEKRVPRTDCKKQVKSKIIQWMIFDGTSLKLVLAEPKPYSPTARGQAV